MYYSQYRVHHIGVGSDVVCSTLIGSARASMRGTDSRMNHAFFMSLIGNDERYMKTDTLALSNAACRGDGNNPPDVGLASNVPPKQSNKNRGVLELCTERRSSMVCVACHLQSS